jgi:hypothetical protein
MLVTLCRRARILIPCRRFSSNIRNGFKTKAYKIVLKGHPCLSEQPICMSWVRCPLIDILDLASSYKERMARRIPLLYLYRSSSPAKYYYYYYYLLQLGFHPVVVVHSSTHNTNTCAIRYQMQARNPKPLGIFPVASWRLPQRCLLMMLRHFIPLYWLALKTSWNVCFIRFAKIRAYIL